MTKIEKEQLESRVKEFVHDLVRDLLVEHNYTTPDSDSAPRIPGAPEGMSDALNAVLSYCKAYECDNGVSPECHQKIMQLKSSLDDGVLLGVIRDLLWEVVQGLGKKDEKWKVKWKDLKHIGQTVDNILKLKGDGGALIRYYSPTSPGAQRGKLIGWVDNPSIKIELSQGNAINHKKTGIQKSEMESPTSTEYLRILTKARKEKGHSITDLASILGTSPASLYDLAKGRNINYITFLLLSEYLNINPYKLRELLRG